MKFSGGYCVILGNVVGGVIEHVGHNWKTFYDIQMELGALVARDNMHMYSKMRNFYVNQFWVLVMLLIQK